MDVTEKKKRIYSFFFPYRYTGWSRLATLINNSAQSIVSRDRDEGMSEFRIAYGRRCLSYIKYK